jgi:hypothetical protein
MISENAYYCLVKESYELSETLKINMHKTNIQFCVVMNEICVCGRNRNYKCFKIVLRKIFKSNADAINIQLEVIT